MGEGGQEGEEMNKGVEILMARMDSNPDEFIGLNNKWADLIERAEDYMEPEDRKALTDKFNALQMEKFTEHVMKKLLAAEEGDGVTLTSTTHPTGLAGSTHAQYTAALAQSMAQTQHTVASNLLQNAYANTSTISLQGSNQLSNSIRLGDQTLTANMIKKLKGLVK